MTSTGTPLAAWTLFYLSTSMAHYQTCPPHGQRTAASPCYRYNVLALVFNACEDLLVNAVPYVLCGKTLPGLALFEIPFDLSTCSDGSDAAYKVSALHCHSLPLGAHVPCTPFLPL